MTIGESGELRKKTWLGLTLGIALIYLAFLPPGIYSIDGNGMLAVAESLVANHSFAVPPDLGVAGRGGQFFGKCLAVMRPISIGIYLFARCKSQIRSRNTPLSRLSSPFS